MKTDQINRLATPSKAWDAQSIQLTNVEFCLSAIAETELRAVVSKFTRFDPEELEFAKERAPQALAEIEVMRRQVERVCGFAMLRPITGIEDPEQCRAVSWIVGSMLGEPIAQNEAGDRLICVFDRDRTRRMQDGARYHQTREGGSLHTDNVNVLEHWDYLIMTCVAPAMLGGESILVSGATVYNILKEEAPQAVDILCEDFWWESRGISDALFRAPIITFNEWGEAEYRYLRPYLASAHAKAGDPLTETQLWAIDTLDSVLETSSLQFRHKLKSGQTLIINDNQVFHGRTSFSDYFDGAKYMPDVKARDKRFNRFFDRVWIRASTRTLA